jgi:ABC-type sugar transport system ATPase subunit
MALDQVSFAANGGEVMALVGDNGAGKSTLAKVFAGAYRPSDGVMHEHGRPVQLGSPRDAAQLGIPTIYQDLALADNLSVTENVFLGCEATVRVLGVPILRKGAMRQRARCSTASTRTSRTRRPS